MSDITQLLQKASGNKDPKVQEAFLNAVYNELRIIARAKMAKERPGQTIQPTILAHDAWLKLFPEGSSPTFENKAHFFGTVARVMRNILVDRARARLAIKRGGVQVKVSLEDEVFGMLLQDREDLLIEEVNAVLEEIETKDPQTFMLVQMKFFLDMNMEDVADKLGISLSTAERLYRSFKKQYKARFKELI